MISGIVAEYNPFHTGHKYLLEQAEGVKIVVMSGNFVQRGEPAIVDKWTRAQMALEHGADLVVEMPFLVSVQSADHFAKGAIDILYRLGVEKLVFGTEEMLDYQRITDIYVEKSEKMEMFVKNLPENLSYPQKTQIMWQEFAGLSFTGDTPNHILALAYAKAVAGTGIQLSPVQRQGAGFHSEEVKTSYASATAIRKGVDQLHLVRDFLPSAALFEKAIKVGWNHYFSLLRYQITTHQDLSQIFQVNDELASRIRSAIGSVTNVEELVNAVATKRYTKARVRRILTYILVNAVETPLPKAIHVLGFTSIGQAYLKQVKDKVDLVTRIGKEPWDSLTQQADSVYQLGAKGIAEQTYGRVPVRRNITDVLV
ncbi:nucleotidyltransferase [Streptococcus ruminantium]|uniref:nucleotidyltransferase n=1 Tax=Streptococcus ruminantium TaxID=1917441 RepID=UPI0012DE49EF|nr:nucleotidyltransferase [Streptococcus ruminantium]